MPTVKNFGGFRITMYFEDHNPPHFHVVAPTQEAVVEIATMTVVTGAMAPARLRVALAWATNNRALLLRKWDELHTA
ncbi:MAG: DUF4160 domain-containing protein [Micropepsaceae bacterium]